MRTIRAVENPEEGLFPLFFGALGPPIIWAVRIGVNYVLVPYVCWGGWTWLLHLVTLAALLGTAAAGGVAWNRWRQVGSGNEIEFGGLATRTRFMALFGMVSSAFFFLVMVAEWLPSFFVHPCQTAGLPLA